MKKFKPMNKMNATIFFILMLLTLGSAFCDTSILFELATILSLIGTVLGIVMIFFNKSLDLTSRLLFLFFTFISSIAAYQHILDFPAYVSKDYSQIEGIALIEQGRGRGAGLDIKINDIELGYNVPDSIKVADSGKYFKISYLPHTKVIVHWEIIKDK